MIALLLLPLALAAEPCPGLALGDPVPVGVVAGGRLACDGLLLSTEDARAPMVEVEQVRLDLVAVRQELADARADLATERERRREAEVRAAVAEARLQQATVATARPLPTWAALTLGGVVTAAGTGLGVAACHAVGAP